MIPILFAENSTDFTTNGIGRLSDAISCVVTEERNGQYELAMEYPISGKHYEDISLRKIIVAKPSINGNIQPFRVYLVTKPIAGKIGVYAQHISYDLSKNVVMPFSVTASVTACAETLAGLKANAVEDCPFNFMTDVTRIAGYNQSTPMSLRSRLGGSEGSVLDQFRGEFEFDVYNVTLHSKRGHDNNVALRYGKNITDLKQEENITNTVTGVVPYWSNMDGTVTVTLPEKVVYSPYAERYAQKLTVPLDLSGEYEEEPDVATIRAAAEAYVTDHNLGVPDVSITVSFVNLTDGLETVSLCDDVHVQFEPLGIDTTAEVVKCVWDVLADRYKEISVGSLRSSLATTLNNQNSQNAAAIEKTKVQAGSAINKATAWLSSGDGYIVAIKGTDGEWKELLAMDTNDIDTAQKVMRLNENGLGGSTHGVGGPYNAAILVDGTIVADAVKTGILEDLNGKFYLNMQTGELSMHDGTFTGEIESSVVKFGSGNLLTEMKYAKVPAFNNNYALAIVGNDRIAIQSTAYQLRLMGKSIHMGDNNENTYINMLDSGDINIKGNILMMSGSEIKYYCKSSDGLKLTYFTANNNKYLGVYEGSDYKGSIQIS